ncbi:TetR/AcrR family transcriptional regulator [Streptomyces chartreusis]|uniref:TetR/AcrR family transcriptional regulator n=1 Tax=Streptomyces chartreusis TaxID=1969 RepID=UPI00363BDE28
MALMVRSPAIREVPAARRGSAEETPGRGAGGRATCTVNDRYGSKAALWRAVVDHALGGQPARTPEVDDSVDDAERLRLIITGFHRSAVDTPLVGRLFVEELNRQTERLDYLYERCIAPTPQTLTPSIERLVAEERMAPVPMDVLFFAVIPPVSGMVEVPPTRRLGRPVPASPEQLTATAETLATLVVNGLPAKGPVPRG